MRFGDILGDDITRRMEEIREAHTKRHPNCTADNCHTQYMIELIDETRQRIASSMFLLELHRL